MPTTAGCRAWARRDRRSATRCTRYAAIASCPKAGLSPPALPEGPSRCLTGAAFTRSHTASANPEKRSAQLRLIRARVAATSLTPNRSAMASALGQQLVVEQIDRQEARAILHRGRDLLGKRRPGFPSAPAAAAAIRPMLGDDQRLGQIEHRCTAWPSSAPNRRGLGVVIDGDVRIGDLAQGLAFCPPDGLPDRSRRLRVRGSRLGLCSPSAACRCWSCSADAPTPPPAPATPRWPPGAPRSRPEAAHSPPSAPPGWPPHGRE